jgi:hypothetical protein
MNEARPCPHCGEPIPIESMTTRAEDQPAPDLVKPSTGAEPEKDLDLASVPLLAPGSHDDVFGSSSSSRIAPAVPDPILGEYVTPASSPSASTSLEEPPSTPPGAAFPTIDLGSGIRPEAAHATTSKEFDSDDIEEFEPGARRVSWTTVLLVSYASAITVGLVWTLMRQRPKEKVAVEAEPTRPVAVAPESAAKQAGLSRKVEPPEPILGHHFVKMGQALLVGDLEIKPVSVKRQGVTLRRAGPYAKPDRKDGGKGALVLRLKLRNVSNEAVFSPLDQAYIRERGKLIVDTFVETADKERIYPFPLAVESEWSIEGQSFDVLRPGESREVAIVSAPDASGPFTWRVRLRTGLYRTDTIGVRWPEK